MSSFLSHSLPDRTLSRIIESKISDDDLKGAAPLLCLMTPQYLTIPTMVPPLTANTLQFMQHLVF